MRLVRPLLPVEVHRRIARIVWLNQRLSTLSLKTLQTRPGFQQCSVHREVLVREQISLSCLPEHGLEEGLGDVPIEQTLAVLGEHGHVANRVIHVQTHKPAEQQVVVELFHQHPFAPHRVQRLQQECSQQLFWRDRRSSNLGVQHIETGLQALHCFVGHGTQGA